MTVSADGTLNRESFLCCSGRRFHCSRCSPAPSINFSMPPQGYAFRRAEIGPLIGLRSITQRMSKCWPTGKMVLGGIEKLDPYPVVGSG